MGEALSNELIKNIYRYASCILGNRQLSHIAVAEALEAHARNGGSSRFRLYQFVNEASASRAPQADVRFSGGCGIGAELLKLPYQRRQIVALRAVMGFSFVDVAEVMEMTETAVRRHYVSSLLELRPKPAVLIIEDEAMIALDLQKIIKTLGLSVAGIAKNREEALRIVGLSHPKLIVADYRLRDETGIDVVNAIREQIHADVIYITAHPEAVTEQLGAASEVVLAKPFNARALVAAVQSKLAA